MQAAKPSPLLIALKPRQVLLSSTRTMKIKASAAQSLNPHQNSLLLLSIAHFLQRKSFSKTLKKFLSEAQIQKYDLTGSSLDLEEMCCKYLAMSDHSSSNLNRERFYDMQVDGNPNSDQQVAIASTVEIATKRKKKRGNESTDTITGQSEVDDKSANSKKIGEQVFQEAAKASATDVMGGLQLNESAKKEKEKKKKKMKLDSESHVECYPSESFGGESEKKSKHALSTESNRYFDAGIEDKTKDKKSKKNKLISDSFVENVDQHGSEDRPPAGTTLNASDMSLEDKTCKSKKKKKKDDSEDVEKEKSSKSKDNKNGTSEVDSTIKDSKGSKKRKRLDSEVHDSEPVDKNAIEDYKRIKTKSPEEQLNSLVGADKCAGKENKGESGETGVDVFLNKPARQLHEQENGNIEKNGKNSEQKSLKKNQNGSVEPKKPFQRVNVDEVAFVDSRLEDNSYWAKGGAENGYGAKAQEILGQVRGRDFRHEKTKKKRGSYRGGQIDLQSHSIKFNYSDDE